MVSLYPPIEPYERGMLEVGDGNRVSWEVSGSPTGKPAVVLHGGPGQGCSSNMRRAFDPAVYRVVLFDQRGCGRSTPHASDPRTSLAVNTMDHLVGDMELLRAHLGIERWLVSGASFGATLALAYAERHPARVTEIVLSSITTSSRSEAEWLYGGAARFFPEAWEVFRAHVPEAAPEASSIIAAYARRLDAGSPDVRLAAARAWGAWEDAVLSLEPHAHESSYSQLPADDLLALVRICTHYLAHHAWLEEGALLRGAHRLAGIPGVMIHGRRDMSCPVATAWSLARAWPDSALIVLDDAGHLRAESKRLALLRAYERFGRR